MAASTRLPIRRTESRINCSSRSSASRGGWMPFPGATLADASATNSSICASTAFSAIPSWLVMGGPRSAESAGDVVLGHALLRVGEDLDGVAVLDDIAGPVIGHVEEHRLVRRAGGLLHVV